MKRQVLKRKNASWDDKYFNLLAVNDTDLQYWLSAN